MRGSLASRGLFCYEVSQLVRKCVRDACLDCFREFVLVGSESAGVVMRKGGVRGLHLYAKVVDFGPSSDYQKLSFQT